ncbi:protein hairy-like [Leguminivora glycinivorella]|uniref:protein hairy-like n=1 Tax=Leguminivora glycinivorella TaxID=1035111 RepID=UPI00200C4EE1|nr:protein hairy-like [Leguminivora glycinivorella]
MVADVGQTVVIPQSEKRDDIRKSNKPIMEKRRRARINNCLNELKALILDVMKKDPASHSKLEKADILEMTVKHLGGLRSGAPDRFRAGYRRCLTEIARFPGLDVELRRKLLKHLEGLVPGTRLVNPSHTSDIEDVPPSTVLISGSGVHLVPTRLPNGDIAFLLPANVNANTLGSLRAAVGTPSLTPFRDPCFSPASSVGSPRLADVDLALVVRKTEDKPWRPW